MEGEKQEKEKLNIKEVKSVEGEAFLCLRGQNFQ